MSELYHYGIKGMHWGIRRYQNADGSLTAAGRARYNTGSPRNGYKGIETKNSSVKTVKSEAKANRQKMINENKAKRASDNAKWKEQRAKTVYSRTRGQNVAVVLLNGPFGALSYNSMRAAGYSRAYSYVESTVAGMLLGPLGNILVSELAKGQYIARENNS